MDYNNYIDKILEDIGRNPKEIAILKYNITYKKLIEGLMLTDNTLDTSIYLNMPQYALQYYMRKGLINTLPEKQGKKSWRTSLLYYIGYIQCPTCDNIYSPDVKNKFDILKGSYYCKSCINKKDKLYRDKTVDKRAEYFKQYYENNRAYFSAKSKKYKLSKEHRVPKWADLEKIEKIYRECPEGYHVDHIIPLHGYNVSGLHVENNLQYLLAKDNLSKGNKFDVDFII